jgi:Meckel syndrome type 1 protein
MQKAPGQAYRRWAPLRGALWRVRAAAVEESQAWSQRREQARAAAANAGLIGKLMELARPVSTWVPSLPNSAPVVARWRTAFTDGRTVRSACIELRPIETVGVGRLALSADAPVAPTGAPAGAAILGVGRGVTAAAGPAAVGAPAASPAGTAPSAGSSGTHAGLESGPGGIAALRPLSAVRASAGLRSPWHTGGPVPPLAALPPAPAAPEPPLPELPDDPPVGEVPPVPLPPGLPLLPPAPGASLSLAQAARPDTSVIPKGSLHIPHGPEQSFRW